MAKSKKASIRLKKEETKRKELAKELKGDFAKLPGQGIFTRKVNDPAGGYTYNIEWYKQKDIPAAVKTIYLQGAEESCRNLITDFYARQAIRNCEVFVFIRSIDENGDAGMIGFSTLRRKKGMAYVDLICSDQKGYGSVLLEASEGLARKAGFRVVTLNAIGPAEGFYKKKGYIQSDEPCTRSPKINRSGSQDDGFRYNKCLVGKEVVRMGKHRKAKDHAGLVRPMTKAQLNEEISKKHREAREKKEKKKRKKVDKKADKKQRKLEKQKAEERIERIWKRKVEEREAKEKEKRVRREKRKRERPKRPIRESTQPKPKPPTRRRRPRKKTRRVQEGRSGFVTASGRCRSRYVKRVYVGGKLESVSYFYYIYKEGRKRRVYLPKKKASSNKVFRRK